MRKISRLEMRLQRNSPQRQHGMTMLGLVFLICFIGVFAFGFIRLTPVYLNYMKVIGVIDGVVAEFEGQGANATAIRRSIGRRFDVESVGEIVAKDVKVTPVDGGLEVAAVYDHSTPFVANISFTVHFNKTEVVRR
ncbi:MAG: DUF4845 domain-containing protein [Gammaproteobacteria bacterium]|nr:DUF4845 domain-containing protein [Gammaproteobacteria bacterium]MDH5303260.1 DUF4845 domain-containing protein [Gammaproteobacteria bacterium]MDH5322038.1 DUF4845 domain-containing protein [Gammaproteobacteria bacterium]